MGDLDDDGDLDLFIGAWTEGGFSKLYRQTEPRRFMEQLSPVSAVRRAIGASWGDIDNDGDVDLVVASGYTSAGRLHAFLNDGSGNLTESVVPGLTDVQSSFIGVNLVDYDNDGRLDVFVTSRRGATQLLRNVSEPRAAWLQVQLSGTAIWGARVALDTRMSGGVTKRQWRSVHQGTGYGGHGAPIAHFGLPAGAVIERITVFWPSGRQTDLTQTRANQRIVVRQPAP
jgi:hypothetical protein